MSKPVVDEMKAREIASVASQMNQPNFELKPEWSEKEYLLVSTIWKIFKSNPGTNGKKIALDEIRKFNRSNTL